MIKKQLAVLMNYLWKKSLMNIDQVIGEENRDSFTATDYFNLTVIFNLGTANFSQIAEALEVSRPAVSFLVRRLERLDLVERIQSKKDRRFYFVKVTEQGRRIMSGDEAQYDYIDSIIRGAVADESQYHLIEDVLEQVVRGIEKEADEEHPREENWKPEMGMKTDDFLF